MFLSFYLMWIGALLVLGYAAVVFARDRGRAPVVLLLVALVIHMLMYLAQEEVRGFGVGMPNVHGPEAYKRHLHHQRAYCIVRPFLPDDIHRMYYAVLSGESRDRFGDMREGLRAEGRVLAFFGKGKVAGAALAALALQMMWYRGRRFGPDDPLHARANRLGLGVAAFAFGSFLGALIENWPSQYFIWELLHPLTALALTIESVRDGWGAAYALASLVSFHLLVTSPRSTAFAASALALAQVPIGYGICDRWDVQWGEPLGHLRFAAGLGMALLVWVTGRAMRRGQEEPSRAKSAAKEGVLI